MAKKCLRTGSSILLAVLCLLPSLAWAQVGIGSGRERDVLRLIEPYVDEGPVGDTRLTGIAIQRDRIVLQVRDLTGLAAELTLRPNGTAGPHAFSFEPGPAPSPALRKAQQLLHAAIAARDDGTFFQEAPPLPGATPRPAQVHHQDTPSTLKLLVLQALSVALWLILAVALVATLVRRPGRWRRLLLVFATWVIALQARESVPFWAMHANQHAFEDAAVAMDVPEAALSTSRALDEYGAGWLVLQRATVPLFGITAQGPTATWSGLARWSAAVSGLAVALTLLAALEAGSGLPWALLGAAVFAWAPVAMRVGHSESLLAVAQLLFAAMALLAARGSRLDRVGLVAAVPLLALGHPLGPAYAAGGLLMAWALLPPVEAPPPGPDRAFLLPDQTLAGQVRTRLARPFQVLQGPVLAALLLALFAGIAIQLAGNAALLRRRTAAVDQMLPWPTNPLEFLLWLDPAWAPLSFSVLVLVGTVGWLRWRRSLNRTELWRAIALPLAMLIVCAAGLLVVASVSDGLRYQAPLAPLLVLLASFAGQAVPSGTWRWPVRIVAIIAALATVAELSRPMLGRTALDGQGQAWQALQRELASLRGDVWMLQPDRETGAPRVVLEAPIGRLDRDGPTLHALRTGSLTSACRDQLPQPAPLLAWLPPDCDVAQGSDATSLCAIVERFSGQVRARGEVVWLKPRYPAGLPGEFHRHPSARGTWRLVEARCR